MSLYHLSFKKESGPENMAVDMWLLNQVEHWGGPIFRRYGWLEPQVTFGYGQKSAWVEQQTGQDILSLTRRPTGGGIVHHGKDLTYCLILPRASKGAVMAPMDFYAQIHRRWGEALAEKGIGNKLMPCPEQSKGGIPGDCFNEPVGRDLMNENCTRKLGGAAMKRTRQGVLVQGTLDLGAWPELAHEDIENRFVEKIALDLDEEVTHRDLPDSSEPELKELVEIYSSHRWNRERKSQ